MSASTPNSPPRRLRDLVHSLPFRSRRHSISSAAVLNTESVVVGGEGDGYNNREVKGGPVKRTVRKLMRRASLSFRPGEKSSFVVTGRRGRSRTLMGDGESGIVLDDKDEGDSYYAEMAKRVDPVTVLPTEITAQILSYLDHMSLVQCESVSRRWREAASNRHVWRQVFRNEHGPWESRPGKNWKQMFQVNHALHASWNRHDMNIKYLKGHTDAVYCVQFDENKVITGSRDRTIRVWDIKTGECQRVLKAPDDDSESHANEFHTASVLCLQFDDQILVTGSSDHSVIVWSLPSYKPIGRLLAHRAGVLDVCFDDKHIISCSKDTTICIWDRHTRKLLRQLKGHRGPVNAVAVRSNQIVSASGDALVKLWDIETGECLREFKGHHRGLACVQFSEDAKTIVSGGNDQDIKIWDAKTGECLRTLSGHKDLVRTLHLDCLNRRIISGSYDATVKVWHLDTGKKLLDITQYHSTWILAAKADYKRIVSTSQDSRTLVLDFSAKIKGIEVLEQ
ncbi:WD40-repeat-containing domain protein [Pyronema domesticum]|uniref:Similar to Beta-TrCP acc. no. Q91854 n=1 Tax=Pyronema omphalodes (strain CBS 100304) TaxID=1076935 RepID=U4LV79_PYROM|nr:WD40-repeat-containing domain protein [Pyronema domesticum]CCX34357.1 Similar to Beta-TrCP; acc. no. Q91854 [Pyronema omphalodes CBS 100304]